MPRDGFRIELKGFKEFSRALDDFARETERRFAEPVRLPVQFELDGDGYLDRACPAPECRNAFKVLWHDFDKIRYDQVAYCAFAATPTSRRSSNTPSPRESVRGRGAISTRRDDSSQQIGKLFTRICTRQVLT